MDSIWQFACSDAFICLEIDFRHSARDFGAFFKSGVDCEVQFKHRNLRKQSEMARRPITKPRREGLGERSDSSL